jgi:hypothetical protein
MPSDFLFVNGPSSSNGDPGLKTLVRKQAMKKAAESRRRNGSHKNPNVRQYPVFRQDAVGREGNAGKGPTTMARVDPLQHLPHFDEVTVRALLKMLSGQSPCREIPPSLPPDSFQKMRMKFSIDPRNLCRLASVEMGRAANEALIKDPRRLLYLISPEEGGSFMSEVPSRYGNCRTLTAATDAVVAIVRSILNDDQRSDAATSMACYSKALRTLQNALNDPKTTMEADILCATQMLSLYEVRCLPFSSSAISIIHAAIRRLIHPQSWRGDLTELTQMTSF